MTYEKRGDTHVICKDGTYFALTLEQVCELSEILEEIKLSQGAEHDIQTSQEA